MKIIAKYKDYYDYIQGVIGIDPLATYDRRDSHYIDSSSLMSTQYETVEEMKKRLMPAISRKGEVIYKEKAGVVVGKTLYILGLVPTGRKVAGMYMDSISKCIESWEMKYELIKTQEVDRGEDTTPVLYIKDIHKTYKGRWGHRKEYPSWSENDEIKNPNLSKTNFASIVPAEEMFLKIQDWILSTREKPIIDSRTDIQKLESAGFDKKTSFRNM